MIIDSLFSTTGILFAALSNTPYILYHTSYIFGSENAVLAIPRPDSYNFGSLPQTADYDHRRFTDRFHVSYIGILSVLSVLKKLIFQTIK